MADLSDVTGALKDLIASILYPTPPTTPNQLSAAGVPVRIEEGWPDPESLTCQLKDGVSVVSIYPLPGERNTTRFEERWDESLRNDPSFTIALTPTTITIGGTQSNPATAQNLVAVVNRKPYAVTAGATDTLSTIAAALAALIVVDVPGTTVSGGVITLPTSALIASVAVGVTGTATKELRRQERRIQVIVWSPKPLDRDTIITAIDPPMAALRFLPLLGGAELARMIYAGSPFTDFDQKQGIFRRDLIYTFEYGTTITESETEVVSTKANLTTALNPEPPEPIVVYNFEEQL